MTVSLFWQGPLGPGKMPSDPVIVERLCQAGVYLRVKLYDAGHTVAYAGQSTSLLARFDQHLTSMLSLSVPIRGPSGERVYTGDIGARMDAYNSLREASVMAATDAARVRFWYALCDNYFQPEHLNLVEGLLQQRIKSRLNDLENIVAAPSDPLHDFPSIWENDISGLDYESMKILENLVGSDNMRVEIFIGDDT